MCIRDSYGAEKLGCAIIPMGGGQTEKQLQLIEDFEPDVIVVTPSYMMTVLDEMERHGIDPAATSLKVGVFGAEPWTEDMRREMEQKVCLLYTSPSPRDRTSSRMPSSA